MDPNVVLDRLQRDIDDENLNMEEMSQVYHDYSQQVEDADDSPTPIMDRFYLQGGNAALATMINLTQVKFETICAIVESVLVPAWTLGEWQTVSAIKLSSSLKTV
ncbi:hypothetical protein H257_13090 [Aphanomyces astaci]|uniref:Uncharacterized protein n=1 Tax=Aphanomyces astaci TaxID=112090 RepID=W4FVX4_APHAT|nr:hypothetical protein H257_13090 [Aphanomyces astaci]ETV71632.1 hypothetical protein H257_13090 [Aphanomyces astaci]|eukprot:XP_009838820.1 hypothetical protein H257_13090 [Aphanomyces astaci]